LNGLILVIITHIHRGVSFGLVLGGALPRMLGLLGGLSRHCHGL
jgi:hypothetical protein